MLRKAYTPAKLFLEGAAYIITGILLFFRPAGMLGMLARLTVWLLALGAGGTAVEFIMHRREKRVSLVKAGLLLLGAIVLSVFPQWVGSSISVVFAVWVSINALCKLLYAVQLHRDKQRGVTLTALEAVVYGLFAAALFVQPLQGMVSLAVLLGVYLVIYGLFALADGVREVLLLDVRGRRIRQRVRIAPPVLLTALIPKWLLRALDDPDDAAETARWTRRETSDDTAQQDLEIFFHLSRTTAMGMGHVDIALGNTVYTYGCYDATSNHLFGAISDGVLVQCNREKYIPYCLKHEKKKLISFGVTLTQEQRARVQEAADAFIAGSEAWTPSKGSDMADFAAAADAAFHKLREGRFKTYNVLKTNCVALADILCGASGLDLMNTQGIVTPGTYYAFLDRQFRRRNSIVISRTVYR